MTSTLTTAAHGLVADLRRVFADRLRSVVAYGPRAEGVADAPLTCLALVTSLTMSDLEACAAVARDWRSEHIATPLILAEDEFRDSLDAFVRRDIGSTSAIPVPRMPQFLLGLGGPIGRAAGANLGAAIWWGLGIGFFGITMGSASRGFMDQLRDSPAFMHLLQTAFPGIDYASAGGFLQLLFVEFGVILAGLAAATFISGWASDETSGRLEMVLATPLSRLRWALGSGVGLVIDVVVFLAITIAGIAIGVASSGSDVSTPATGALILGIYAIALVGIGMLVGGWLRTSWAAAAVVIFLVLTWFVQLLGPLLGLPDVLQDLALTSHFGQPMVGAWDVPGAIGALVLGVAGIGLGALGFARRDLRR